MQIDISIVVPVYNSAASLPELHRRILSALAGVSIEIIYVNDASKDNSRAVLRDIRSQSSNVKVLNRKKNRGQHEACILGLKHASGKLIANLDDDLQHDPEYIPIMAKILADERLDIVYAAPRRAELGSRMRDLLFNLLFKKDKRCRVSSFRVYTHDLAQRVLQNLRPYNYFSALVFERPVRARTITLPFGGRKHGKSNYSFLMRVKVFTKILFYYNPWRRRYENIIDFRRFQLPD